MRQYVDANVGPSAKTDRQLLTLAADPLVGGTVTGRARFVPLLELLQALALVSGNDLGFRVVQVGTDLQFQVYTPADKTGRDVFSKALGNLREVEYVIDATELATYVYAGGVGEGTARTFDEFPDPPAIVTWGRQERFLDAREAANATELRQAITAHLAERAERTELRLAPVDTDALAFLTDYALGDKVRVVFDGAVIDDVVREVTLKLTRDGEEVLPAIGTPGIPVAAGLVRRAVNGLRTLRSRTSVLERR